MPRQRRVAGRHQLPRHAVERKVGADGAWDATSHGHSPLQQRTPPAVSRRAGGCQGNGSAVRRRDVACLLRLILLQRRHDVPAQQRNDRGRHGVAHLGVCLGIVGMDAVVLWEPHHAMALPGRQPSRPHSHGAVCHVKLLLPRRHALCGVSSASSSLRGRLGLCTLLRHARPTAVTAAVTTATAAAAAAVVLVATLARRAVCTSFAGAQQARLQLMHRHELREGVGVEAVRRQQRVADAVELHEAAHEAVPRHGFGRAHTTPRSSGQEVVLDEEGVVLRFQDLGHDAWVRPLVECLHAGLHRRRRGFGWVQARRHCRLLGSFLSCSGLAPFLALCLGRGCVLAATFRHTLRRRQLWQLRELEARRGGGVAKGDDVHAVAVLWHQDAGVDQLVADGVALVHQLLDDSSKHGAPLHGHQTPHVLQERHVGLVGAQEPNDLEEQGALVTLQTFLLAQCAEVLAWEPCCQHRERWHQRRVRPPDVVVRDDAVVCSVCRTRGVVDLARPHTPAAHGFQTDPEAAHTGKDVDEREVGQRRRRTHGRMGSLWTACVRRVATATGTLVSHCGASVLPAVGWHTVAREGFRASCDRGCTKGPARRCGRRPTMNTRQYGTSHAG